MSSTTRAAAVDLKTAWWRITRRRGCWRRPRLHPELYATPAAPPIQPCCSKLFPARAQSLLELETSDTLRLLRPHLHERRVDLWAEELATSPMMLITIQRPPTIASVGDLLIGPLSSLPLNSFTNRRRTYPRTKQGLATFSNCSSITIHPGHGVVQLKVADVVNQTKSSGLDFLTVGIFERAPQQAHGDPAPLSAKA